MDITRGITLLEEMPGTGKAAARGDRVVYNLRLFLNHGDEVPLNEPQAQSVPPDMLRLVDDRLLVNHTIILGKRQAVAAVEYTLLGMQAGGYRKVRVRPHLAYRDQGVPGLIPAHAVLVLALWLRSIECCTSTTK